MQAMTAPTQDPQRFAGIHPLPSRAETRPAQDDAHHPDDYDDGLVHNHNWATATGEK